MLLSAFLKLDSAAFGTGIGKALEGVKSVIRVAGDLNARLTSAFDMGGSLNHLAMQTGELPSTLKVLKQAFADTGVGAESLGSALAIMRKSLGGVNDQGEPTGKMFQKLGLDIEAIKGMGAEQQFKVIGDAIKSLQTPAEQTAAAMGIFGRSGNTMLSLFKTDGAIEGARASLGELPALLDRNAAAFDNVSTKIGHIKEKGQGLWAGLAEGLLPLADQVSTVLDGLDLTGWGQRVGRWIGTVTEMFQMAGWGTMVSLLWEVGWKEALNFTINILKNIANILFELLSYPIAGIGALFKRVWDGILQAISKIPKINAMLGLEDFKPEAMGDAFKRMQDGMTGWLDYSNVDLFDASDAKAQLAAAFNQALPVYEEKIARVQAAANAAARGFGDVGLSDNAVAKTGKGGSGGNILSDALQRIGGSIGGTAPNARMEGFARDTLSVNKSMLQKLTKIADGGNTAPVMGWT